MQNRLVFFLIVIAVILAVAGFLLISFLTRPDDPDPGEVPGDEQTGVDEGGQLPGVPVQVDNTTVYIQPVAERAVSLGPDAAPPVQAPPATEVVEPTPQPTVEVIQPTQPQPTQTTEVVAPPPPAASGGQQVTFIDYVVQPGDTLYSIADKQTTSIELMAVHGISSEKIVPGATLRLPVANPAYCSSGRAYVVRPGDTVFSIARRYNTTTQAIASANGLDASFRINVAEVLCIP
jgi:LysM repeat protein